MGSMNDHGERGDPGMRYAIGEPVRRGEDTPLLTGRGRPRPPTASRSELPTDLA